MTTVIKKFIEALSKKERAAIIIFGAVFVLSFATRSTIAFQEGNAWAPVAGGAYREGVIGQPIAINPIISTNPADEDISRLLYSNLSDIIENYEVKEDGKVYVLKLKEGLKWDDNQPLNANDVIFTIETVQDPTSNSPFSKSWRGVIAERVSEVRVSLTIRTPYVFFDKNIERLPIIPKHIFGAIPAANLRLSSYNLEPVGSGPYRLKEYSKRRDGFITSYHLIENENYPKDKPFIKDFYFSFYENINDLAKDIALRKVDGFGSLNPMGSDVLKQNLTIEKIPVPRYYAVFFNPNINPVLKDTNLRTALTEAVNKEKIINDIFSGNAEVVNGPLGNFLLETSSNTIPYDPEDAKDKISALSTKKISLTLIVPKVDFLEKTADAIKSDWLSAGINEVNIIALNPDELMENVIKSNNYEILLFGNVLENSLDLYPFWHSAQRFYPGLNLALYKNSKADNLIETLRQAVGADDQKLLAAKTQDIIVQDKPAIFLFSLPYTYAHIKNLQGLNSGNDNYVVKASDRFSDINKWYLSKVRIIK